MNTCYMITAIPNSDKFQLAAKSLAKDIEAGEVVNQLFFYGEASIVASYDEYPERLEEVIAVSDCYDIALFVCSAAFQRREYRLSSLGQQDFHFMGLGQFIATSIKSDKVRVF